MTLPPGLRTALLPYRHIVYESDLTQTEIGQCLAENVITGFSLFSGKCYYGGFTSFSFSVRKTYSKLKKASLGPTIEGSYEVCSGKMMVTLRLRPHPVLIGVFAFFFIPMAMFWILSVGEFLKTWETDILFSGLVPPIGIYGIFLLVFHIQYSSALRFWEHVLHLRKSEWQSLQKSVVTN